MPLRGPAKPLAGVFLFLWDADVPDKRRDQLDVATRQVFQPRARRPLHSEDFREISTNLTGFFKVLQSWARAEKNNQATTVPESETEKDEN